MFFLKKVLLGLGLIGIIYLGGSGTQSHSLFMQGMGFIGLIIGLIIFYIFSRMIWKGLGCLPSFLILTAVVLFMMYALGLFDKGLSGVGQQTVRFVGYDSSERQASFSQAAMKSEQTFYENFPEETEFSESNVENIDVSEGASADLFGAKAPNPAQKEKSKQKTNIISSIMGNTKGKEEPKPFNPKDYPVIYGTARVINGDTLEIYGKYFQLFGIDAPESNQTCADKQGRSYYCGKEAASWLKSWIGDNELECHVIQQDTKGNMVGTCSYGPYDLGAALVNAGWAVAYVKYTDIYYPYEMQAQKNRRGLWQGTFYKPWDWRALQSRKAKIKVIRPQERKKSIFS